MTQTARGASSCLTKSPRSLLRFGALAGELVARRRRSCRRRRSYGRSSSGGARCCRPSGRDRSFRVASEISRFPPDWRLMSSACSMARPSAARPASRSPEIWTRKARRPRSASTSKSPRACAALTTPKVYFWPGTGRSSASSQVICRNDAAVRAALVGLPGRMQKARAEAEAGRRPACGRGSCGGCSAAPRYGPGCARYRRAAPHSRRRRCGRNAPSDAAVRLVAFGASSASFLGSANSAEGRPRSKNGFSGGSVPVFS